MRLFALAALLFPFTACQSAHNGGRVLDAVDGSQLPLSIHDKPLPLGQQLGVVLNVHTSFLGAFDRAAVDDFSNAVIKRNDAQHAGNKELFFFAVAIDAHQAPALAARKKIEEQDRDSVANVVKEYGVTEEFAQTHVALFFNDGPRKIKAAFSDKPNDGITTAVVDKSGAIVGRFTLPAQRDDALALLDKTIADSETPAAPAP
jgi:hypothetical protein